jgi:hypothetical protein
MKRSRVAIVAGLLVPVLAVLSSWSVHSLAAEPEGTVDRCLKGSGILEQLEDLTPAILFAIPDDAFPQKRSKAEAASFLKRSVTKTALVAHVRAAVVDACDEATLEKVAAFYDSPVGRRAARGLRPALEPHVLKEIREGRSVVSGLSAERITMLLRIVRASRTGEVNERLLISVVHALVEGYLAEQPESAVKAENIRNRLKAMEDEIRGGRGKTEDVALLAASHAFRSMDDRDLEKLADYEESEPARCFGTAAANGLERAVYEAARALGEYAGKPSPARDKKSSPGQNDGTSRGTENTQRE